MMWSGMFIYIYIYIWKFQGKCAKDISAET